MTSKLASKSREEIENLIAGMYSKVGGDPEEIHIKPMDGGWDNALSYEVTRNDGLKIRVFRRDVDDGSNHSIYGALQGLLRK